MTPEKERMKKLCQPVIEWVKNMKTPLSLYVKIDVSTFDMTSRVANDA